MQRVVHLALALIMLAGLTGMDVSARAQTDDILDLADVPLAVQELPESGYQVLTGGYISIDETVRLIADARNLDEANVSQWFSDVRLTRAYVLDLVLPEDRGWQNSPLLAVLQTSVFLLDDDGEAEELSSLLQNYANTSFVTEMNPAVSGAYTISFADEGGDQLRTIVSDGRVVIEIVSLDATGTPDETEHMLIVEATLDRLDELRNSPEMGLSPMALTMLTEDNSADFAHTQQTGVHGIYRHRDAGVQPAIGELSESSGSQIAGMESLYVGSGIVRAGGGNGIVSVWLGSFDSERAAVSFFDVAVSGFPASELADPYFDFSASETWTEQGVLGVYRVSGTLNGQPYSGHVEVRQWNNLVVAVGYRSVGATLSSTNTTSSIMDHQLECLEAQSVCPPFELVIETAPPQATPVLSSPGLGSTEFGWSLPELDSNWIVDERFTDSGYDRLGLRNGVSIFEIESVINHHGEPVQCVLDELHVLEEFEEHSVITVWEDADGNTEGGNTQNQAWVIYRVEPLAEERADQEYVIRIDCFSLLTGSANLVVKHIAPVDFWEEEQEKGSFLRDAIEIPESLGDHGKLGLSAHDRRTTMINFHWIDRAA